MTRRTVDIIFLLSFWDCWRWYLHRVMDGSDEPLCILAISIFIIRIGRKSTPRDYHLGSVGALSYAVITPFVPPIVRALMALSSLWIYSGVRTSPLSMIGLLGLSLPSLASVQFFIGYPLRVVSSRLSLVILKLSGISCSLEGFRFLLPGKEVWVDAPCSGIAMLWCALFFVTGYTLVSNISQVRAFMLLTGALLAVIIGNVARTSSLVVLESGILTLPPSSREVFHSGAGIASYIFVIGCILFLGRSLCSQNWSLLQVASAQQ